MTVAFAVALAVPRAVPPSPCRSDLTGTKPAAPALAAAPRVDLADADDDDAIDDDGGDASLAPGDLTATIAPLHDGRPITTVPSSLLPGDVRIGVDTPRAPPYLSHIG